MNMPDALKNVPKSVVIMSAIAIIAVVGLLVVTPMVMGSDEVIEQAPPPAAQGALVEAGGPPAVTSFGDPASAGGPLPRDPFAPLIAPAVLASAAPVAPPPGSSASPAPAPAAPPAPAVPVPAPAPPAQAPAPAPAPAPPAPAPPPAPPPPAPPPPPPSSGPKQVTLIDVFVDTEGVLRAAVRVSQAMYAVRAGESFDSSYRVLSIADNCATFTRSGQDFFLCKGETVTK